MVGYLDATFGRSLNSTPNDEFEKVVYGYVVIRAQTIS